MTLFVGSPSTFPLSFSSSARFFALLLPFSPTPPLMRTTMAGVASLFLESPFSRTSPSGTVGNGVSTHSTSPHHHFPNSRHQSTVSFKPSSNLVFCFQPSVRSLVALTAYLLSLKGRWTVY